MEKKKPVAKSQKPKVISLQYDATFFFERAVQSLDRFHYDKALKYFRRAVEYEPENPVNHCNMAGILSEMGNYEQSNEILRQVVENIDPSMTECYFYMANNYANMEDFESSETALIYYLEHDPNGQFLDEAEEMMELLSYELDRPTRLRNIKSREGLFEHDKARELLEEGKFSEAVRVLEKLIKKHPDFLAARNNLALAYYYMGQFEKSLHAIHKVLELDPGNLHALCNLAIFHKHMGDEAKLKPLMDALCKTYPFHQEHVFKLATTMGILGQDEHAYRQFRRLIKSGEASYDPCLYHYAAVASYNCGKYEEAKRLWKQTEKLDPASDIPRFYLSQLEQITESDNRVVLSYHYHLPLVESFRVLEKMPEGIPDHMRNNPMIRSSFFWALRHGDRETKLQVIQAFGLLKDTEAEDALRQFVADPNEDDYLKKLAQFALRSLGAEESVQAVLEGKSVDVSPASRIVPMWEQKWQDIMELALRTMNKRYDMIQQHDSQTLWVEFLTRAYPSVPKMTKMEGWAAALEYLTAKMHRKSISYNEVAERYGASVSTISKNVKIIDEVCGLREKMNAIFPTFTEKL